MFGSQNGDIGIRREEYLKRDGDAEVMGHRRASQAGIWIKREEFCAGFVMGDKGGGVTKKTQNRDKTPATLQFAP